MGSAVGQPIPRFRGSLAQSSVVNNTARRGDGLCELQPEPNRTAEQQSIFHVGMGSINPDDKTISPADQHESAWLITERRVTSRLRAGATAGDYSSVSPGVRRSPARIFSIRAR